MMSARTPVFRAFPRNGIPPHYGTWEIYSRRVELMMESGAIEDYTYLWWDVRPHPNLGTVETRVFDQQTRLEHTLALAALTLALCYRLSQLFDDGEPLVETPTELVDDNKVRAALRGLEGELVDFPHRRQRPAAEMVRHLLDELGEGAEELGCATELGGHRGPDRRGHRRAAPARGLRARPGPRRARHRPRDGRAKPPRRSLSRGASGEPAPRWDYPRLDVRARAERRLQELRLRGQPLRHRVPVLRHAAAQAGAEARAPRRRAHGDRAAAARRAPRPAASPRLGASRAALRD